MRHHEQVAGEERVFSLPFPLPLDSPLSTAFVTRRSSRPSISDSSPSWGETSTLLHHSLRLRPDGRLAVPVGGGLHVLRCYVAQGTAMARYEPDEHGLAPVGFDPSLLLEWCGRSMGNPLPAPFAFLLAWIPGPKEKRYGKDALSLVRMETGAVYLAMGLVCSALGLMGCGIGPQAFKDAHERAGWPYERLVGAFAVGKGGKAG